MSCIVSEMMWTSVDLKEYNRAEEKCQTYQKIVYNSHVHSQSREHVLGCSGAEEYTGEIFVPHSHIMPCYLADPS